MERMRKARAGAACMTLMNTKDPIARDFISNAQSSAIVELASKESGLPSLSAEAHANLHNTVAGAPWAPGDLVKVLHALSAIQAENKSGPKEKTQRLPLQV